MPRRPTFSDEQIQRALRAAATACGEPLSHTAYDRVSRDVDGPSSARIIQRFGSWRRACEQAGVQSGAPMRAYEHRWDVPTVTAKVAEYLASRGCPGTFAGYEQWAKGDPGRPSGATVRNVLGGWDAAKTAAAGT